MKLGGKNKQKSWIRDLHNWNVSVLLVGEEGLILKKIEKITHFQLTKKRSDLHENSLEGPRNSDLLF